MWSYGGIRIYVDTDSGRQANPRVDMLNPLTTELTTYIRQHGRDSDSRKIAGHCIQAYRLGIHRRTRDIKDIKQSHHYSPCNALIIVLLLPSKKRKVA